MLLLSINMPDVPTPSPTTVSQSQEQMTTCRQQHRNINDIALVDEDSMITIAIVANGEIDCGSLSVSSDFICPLSMKIPEDPVLLGDNFSCNNTVYERKDVERYIELTLKERLYRAPRTITDPTSRSVVYTHVYSEADGGITGCGEITSTSEVERIIHTVLRSVDVDWEVKLRAEVEKKRLAPLSTNQTVDGTCINVNRFYY